MSTTPNRIGGWPLQFSRGARTGETLWARALGPYYHELSPTGNRKHRPESGELRREDSLSPGSAMNETSLKILNRQFRESAEELLDHYKVEVDNSNPMTQSIELVATIGFGSDEVAGAIALCTSHRCAEYLVTKTVGKNEHDWLGELANQLLGRLKRRCSNHGVTFAMGVPVLFKGERISIARSLDLSRSLQLAFHTPEGTLEAWLDFKTSSNVEFLPEPMKNDSPSEGEILLF